MVTHYERQRDYVPEEVSDAVGQVNSEFCIRSFFVFFMSMPNFIHHTHDRPGDVGGRKDDVDHLDSVGFLFHTSFEVAIDVLNEEA